MNQYDSICNSRVESQSPDRGEGDGVSTVSAATSYYFRRNSFKIVLDYTRTHRRRADGATANDQAFLVQAQLMP